MKIHDEIWRTSTTIWWWELMQQLSCWVAQMDRSFDNDFEESDWNCHLVNWLRTRKQKQDVTDEVIWLTNSKANQRHELKTRFTNKCVWVDCERDIVLETFPLSSRSCRVPEVSPGHPTVLCIDDVGVMVFCLSFANRVHVPGMSSVTLWHCASFVRRI